MQLNRRVWHPLVNSNSSHQWLPSIVRQGKPSADTRLRIGRTLFALRARRFVQEPNAVFALVNPILDETGRCQVAMPRIAAILRRRSEAAPVSPRR